MLSLHFSAEAEADFRESYDYYEQQLEGLEERFEQAVLFCFQKISEHPEHYGTLAKGLRRMRVPDFPFIIVFEADFEVGEIYVVAVAHTSRDMSERYKRK